MVPTTIEKQPPHVRRLNYASVMVYNILYLHKDNDGLSLQQGGGCDSGT